MELLRTKRFILPSLDKGWLRDHKFRPSQVYPDCYVKKFPVFYQGDAITLMCDAVAFPDGFVRVVVYDSDFKGRYAPFYYAKETDKDRSLDIINYNIHKELEKMGIEEDKNAVSPEQKGFWEVQSAR